MAADGRKVVAAVVAVTAGVTLLFVGLTLGNLDKIRTSVAVRRSSRPILQTGTGEMVIVPEGEFQAPSWEKPPQLPPFYIDKEPVSAKMIAAFQAATGRNVMNFSAADEKSFCEWAGKRLPSAEELAKAGRGATVENDVSIYGVRGLARGEGFRCALDAADARKFR